MFDPSNINRAWCAFVDTLLTVARGAEGEGLGCAAARLAAWGGAPGAGGAEVLRNFFLTPSHRVAIQTLNYSLFLTPIPFDGHPFPLQDTMALFSPLGGVRFGRVWLGLVDVAEASGVPDVAAARNYAHAQTAQVQAGGSGPGMAAQAAVPSMAQIDSILQIFGSAIPGLEEIKPMISQILGGFLSATNGVKDESDTINLLQNNLLRPLLEGLGRTPTGDVDLSGPIQQIVSGFGGLTEALSTAHSADGSSTMKM